jgi:hypothetical protein
MIQRRRLSLPGFHYSAGPWAAAGNRFTKLRVVPPLPISAYRTKISSVPLTGGQASGAIPGFPGTSGTANAPAAFTLLCEAIVPVAGTYSIRWTVTLSGTPGGPDANNFGLAVNNVEVLPAVNAGAPGTYPQPPFTTFLNAGDRIEIFTAGNNGSAGSVYGGQIFGGVLPLTLAVGPQGLGTAWYPAQVTLSTTTGVLDSSTATVYLGVGGVPTNQVGSVFSGNGVAALAVPPLQAGDFLFVTWVNGHLGDVASMNVIGTMDALTTGRG